MTTNGTVKAVGESTPPLSIGFDIAIAMCRRADELGHPYPSPELRVWLANRITEAVNAARTASAIPVDRIVEAVLSDVMDLPDRSSPEDWPEAMLVTGDELDGILRARLDDPPPSP